MKLTAGAKICFLHFEVVSTMPFHLKRLSSQHIHAHTGAHAHTPAYACTERERERGDGVQYKTRRST